MAQAQVTTSQQAVTSYWDLAQQLSGIDATICWCQNRGLLFSQKDCHCGRSCRVVKRSRYPGKFPAKSTMADPQFTVSDKFAEGVAWRCPRKGCQCRLETAVSFRTAIFLLAK